MLDCDTYRLTYRCTNCGACEERNLERGTLAPHTLTCVNCGCRTAHPLSAGAPVTPRLPPRC